MIGKFENEEALLKSYGDLEKEFTKKCQELSRVKKELEMRESEKQVECDEDDNGTIVIANDAGEDAGQPVEGEEVATAETVNTLENEEFFEPEMTENLDGDVDNLTGGQDLSRGDNLALDNLLVRAKANEFLISNADAREYARDIAKVLLSDKSLLSCSDPFGVAYALVLKNKQKIDKNEVKVQENLAKIPIEKQGEELNTKSTISLLGKNLATFSPARVVQKYRTMDDARAELMRRFS